MVQPTAIGLTPPSFLFNATKVVPKKKGRINSGTRPSRMRLTSDVSDDSINIYKVYIYIYIYIYIYYKIYFQYHRNSGDNLLVDFLTE